MKKEWDAAVKALKKFGDETNQYVTLELRYTCFTTSDTTQFYRSYSEHTGHSDECLTPMDAVIQCINKYKEEVKKRA
jgi:hypothetical protein